MAAQEALAAFEFRQQYDFAVCAYRLKEGVLVELAVDGDGDIGFQWIG